MNRPKHDFVFLEHDHPCISLEGSWQRKEDHAIGLGLDSRVSIRLKGVSDVHGLFISHDWSGKVLISEDGAVVDCADLYSRFGYKKTLPLKTGDRRDVRLEIRAIGKNENSLSCQVVFCGLLLLKDEYDFREGGRSFVKEFGVGHADPVEFQRLQENMVDNWIAAIEARGERVEDVVASRFRAYRKRIRTALIYPGKGERLLDIGAGNIFEEMLTDVIMAAGVDYWTLDIDKRVVDGTKALFSRHGLDPEHARHGENTVIPFESGFFDAVFSSHCIEHSRDLGRTFSEIHRVLRPGGHLVFAVPFGWDDTPEHIYALDIDDWIRLTAQFNFDVLSCHVGKEYPESGRDLLIAAKRTD